LLRLGVKALPLFSLFAADIDSYALFETSSRGASTASLAASGSAGRCPHCCVHFSIGSAKDVTFALPAEIEKRWPFLLAQDWPERASLELASLRVALAD